ncbi:hypothetical protein ACGFT2_18735 [Streptomyces sp. NPDC048514]|uniref:hypothetical protein n=1 Tax=Streptomyces sp. NPDC048514 TaxID=3365564 RepID=UPI0037199719
MSLRSAIERPAAISYEPFTKAHALAVSSRISGVGERAPGGGEPAAGLVGAGGDVGEGGAALLAGEPGPGVFRDFLRLPGEPAG